MKVLYALTLLAFLQACVCTPDQTPQPNPPAPPAQITNAEFAAAVATAYCLAAADISNYATYSVARDFGASATCADACSAFARKHYPNAKGGVLEGRGVGDLECTIFRSNSGEVEGIVGRPGSYYEDATPYCDWCCCQLK
ncbi:MAG: hypothetical protein H6993_07785 [Pseudomonadales bacterium]|nr:hypothetical protein [Pseudomonadales bacterium]